MSENGRLRHGEGTLGWGAQPPEGAKVAYALDVPVPIDGKVRSRITIAANAARPELEAAALSRIPA